jgi:hypothetical protein
LASGGDLVVDGDDDAGFGLIARRSAKTHPTNVQPPNTLIAAIVRHSATPLNTATPVGKA